MQFSHLLHSNGLTDFKIFELFPVVLSFFDSTIDGCQLLFVLILFQLWNWFDFNDFNRSFEPTIQLHQFLFMLILKRLQLLKPIFLKFIKLLSPLVIEFLQSFLPNVLVFFELTILDCHSQLFLIMRDVSLQKSHLFHQILIQSVLLNLRELLTQQLHLLFDETKDADLLILVQKAVSISIEHGYKVRHFLYS